MDPDYFQVFFIIGFFIPIVLAGIGAYLCCDRKGFSKGWVVGACLLPAVLFFLEGIRSKKEHVERASGGEIACLVIVAFLFCLGVFQMVLNN